MIYGILLLAFLLGAFAASLLQRAIERGRQIEAGTRRRSR